MMKPLRLIPALLIALLATVGTAAAHNNRNFVAHLSGDEEVPPVATLAQGQAIFHLSKDGSQLEFKLIVANIENVTQAHIHCGAVGVNGPVVAFLYGLGPVVSPDGILSEGTVTGANVIPRPPSAACPGGVANFDDLIAKIQTGGAYANVHTTDHPGGEVRGQIH
jgi:hypothetical protein